MIHYALRCGAGHEFDGWFNSGAGFDTQAAQGLLECPFCASTDIRRAIMAPRLGKGSRVTAAREAAEATPAVQPAAVEPAKSPGQPPMPDQVRAVLQRIRIEVEKKCDYVGEKFAVTARRMHAGDEPHRPIYGEATNDEAVGLSDDGIAVSRVPWVPRADS